MYKYLSQYNTLEEVDPMFSPLRWMGTAMVFIALVAPLPEGSEGGQLGMQFPEAVPREKGFTCGVDDRTGLAYICQGRSINLRC